MIIIWYNYTFIILLFEHKKTRFICGLITLMHHRPTAQRAAVDATWRGSGNWSGAGDEGERRPGSAVSARKSGAREVGGINGAPSANTFYCPPEAVPAGAVCAPQSSRGPCANFPQTTTPRNQIIYSDNELKYGNVTITIFLSLIYKFIYKFFSYIY